MKLIIAGVVLAIVMGLATTYRDSILGPSASLEYVKKVSTLEVQPEVKTDVIDEAKKELDRINAELDTEEAKLLEDRKAIDARLEKLRETRVSFQ